MAAVKPFPLIPVLSSLALVLAVTACGGVVHAHLARREACRMRHRARAASTRAALAESALADMRHRRSLAVSLGNRTRAETRRAARLAIVEELRSAANRRHRPQGELPFAAKDQGR